MTIPFPAYLRVDRYFIFRRFLFIFDEFGFSRGIRAPVCISAPPTHKSSRNGLTPFITAIPLSAVSLSIKAASIGARCVWIHTVPATARIHAHARDEYEFFVSRPRETGKRVLDVPGHSASFIATPRPSAARACARTREILCFLNYAPFGGDRTVETRCQYGEIRLDGGSRERDGIWQLVGLPRSPPDDSSAASRTIAL